MSTSTSGIQQHLLTFTVCITICILISFAQLVAWPAWQRTAWHPGCHKPRVAVWEHKCWKNSPTSTTIQSTDRLNFTWHQAQENNLRDALCTCSIPIHLILGPWPSFLTKETCLQQATCAASLDVVLARAQAHDKPMASHRGICCCGPAGSSMRNKAKPLL